LTQVVIGQRSIQGAELVSSRDGIAWDRPFPHQFFLSPDEPGSWDESAVRPVPPVIHQDEVWIYYGAWNGGIGVEHLKRAERGEPVAKAIGLATLPLDRFVSLKAGNETGVLTTK